METNLSTIFNVLEQLKINEKSYFLASNEISTRQHHKLPTEDIPSSNRPLQWLYVDALIDNLKELSNILKNDLSVMISVKNQKLLRSCYHMIVSLGLVPCLIPGVGIDLIKRSQETHVLPTMKINDTDKYSLLKQCTDFLIDSYAIPVLKNIILMNHLSDYLAALIQLSQTPLKKPGVYKDFTMTEELFETINKDQFKYGAVYEELVCTSFQPLIMKELLVLQGSTQPPPPAFFKKVLSKELSRRFLSPGGLFNLMRCFIDGQNIDTGQEWNKIDMICRIVATKHGNISNDTYIDNISKQLKDILSSQNTQFYSVAAVCTLHLREKFTNNEDLELLFKEIFNCFNENYLQSKNCLPGSILLTSEEVDHSINCLHSFVSIITLDETIKVLLPNIYVLTAMRLKCTKSRIMQCKLDTLILKILGVAEGDVLSQVLKEIIFGEGIQNTVIIEEYDCGIILKSSENNTDHPIMEASKYVTEILKKTNNVRIASKVFEISLDMLLQITKERDKRDNHGLMEFEDDPVLVDKLDAKYAATLQFLEVLCTVREIISPVMNEPECVIRCIESIVLDRKFHKSEECLSIALVLLNTLLFEANENVKGRCSRLIPVLSQLSLQNCTNGMLANEVIMLINSPKDKRMKSDTPLEKALIDAFDSLLPVKGHGLITITKLIDAKDPETISKKHYILCLFQEHLKDEDSYLYLAAINGIAALGWHCTDDVLNVLCKEYLESSLKSDTDTADVREQLIQTRMKVGDIIVKVTRGLGEMAVAHKALLLNTVLCACRDDDFLLRASALSNLAEIALVLNYRLGSVLFEIFVCICGVLDSDPSPECRRAAVMVVSSLFRGLGKDTLIQLKDTLLPLYRTLKKLYGDEREDAVVRLHAQLALEELNNIVTETLFKIDMERNIVTDLEKIDIRFK